MIETPRLRLRQWYESDKDPFAALNADPLVMEHFPGVLRRAQSDQLAESAAAHIASNGWGLFAVEEKETRQFIGFVGLNPVRFDAPFTPAVEIGWRLARPFWGKGYASEAARRSVELAFNDLGLDALVSFTTVANYRSRRVMERLGMHHDPDGDFLHPKLPDGHPIAPHVLYRLSAVDWAQTK